MNNVTAAHTLKELRLKAGLTQQQLADKAGLDRSWMNQMERGRRPITPSPRAKLAAALAAALDMEVTAVSLELGGGDGEAPTEFRSLHQRLEELEARLAAEEGRRLRSMRATTRRLAEFEAALDALARQEGLRRQEDG